MDPVQERLCLPLDGLHSLQAVYDRIQELGPFVGMFKIGTESYTRFGPKVVTLAQQSGHKVFLDLKLHDIPQTVYNSAKAAAELRVTMMTVHASGGVEMMQAAKKGSIATSHTPPTIVAITVLTSIDQEVLQSELQICHNLEEHVLHLGKLAQQAGLHGIVCSPTDLASIRNYLPATFVYVTPGLKGPGTEAGHDQRRVLGPRNALEEGASILVIGRAITNFPTPDQRMRAAASILEDMKKHLKV